MATVYHKTCKCCGKEFESEARNTRYCSQACCDKMQKVGKAKAKKCAKRRKAYDEDKELQRLIGRAYSLTQAIGELLPKPDDFSEETYELHHGLCDPFNMNPLQLFWAKKGDHERYHQSLPVTTTITLWKELLRNPEVLAEYREAYEKMIESGDIDANRFTVFEIIKRLGIE